MHGNEDRTRRPALDVTYFEQLQRDFAPETFRELVEGYLEQAGALVRELDRALAERDGERVGQAAHKLRGSSATLGARALTDLCAALEQQVADDDWAAAAGMSTKLEAARDATSRALEARLSRVQRAGPDR